MDMELNVSGRIGPGNIHKRKATPNTRLSSGERVRYRHAQRVLYHLERRLGVPSALYEYTKGTYDPETSKDFPFITQIPINLVSWDVTFNQRFEYDISFIAADKNFAYGGVFKTGDRIGIFSARWLPGDFEFKNNYYVMLDDKRYNIQKYLQLDFQAGYLVHLRLTDGQESTKLQEEVVQHKLQIAQDIVAWKTPKASLEININAS